MRTLALKFGTAALLGILLATCLFTCHRQTGKKVPLSTKSEKALEYYFRARDLAEKLRAQEASEWFRKAIAEDSTFAMAYLNLAFVQPSAKQFLESLNKAIHYIGGVSDGEKYWILGVDAGVKGSTVKQLHYFQKLAEKYPNDERAQNLLGNFYFGQQQFELAITRYKRAVEIDPDFSQPYNQMGYCYRYLERYDEAGEAFEKYIQLIPDDPNPHDSYAELLMKTGKFEESIKHYRRALVADSLFVPSYIGIATDLNFLDRHEEARKILDDLGKVALNDGQRRAARFAAAVSYIDEGKPDLAIGELKKMMNLAEKNQDTLSIAGDLRLRGAVYLETGDAKNAELCFAEALKLIQQSSQMPEIQNNAERIHLFDAGRVALLKNNLEEAKKLSRQFLKRAEAINNQFQIWFAHRLAGQIAMKEGNYDLAIEELLQANQQNPYNLYRLAQAYKQAGDSGNARKYLQKAAHHNTLNSLSYAFIRQRAQREAAKM